MTTAIERFESYLKDAAKDKDELIQTACKAVKALNKLCPDDGGYSFRCGTRSFDCNTYKLKNGKAVVVEQPVQPAAQQAPQTSEPQTHH